MQNAVTVQTTVTDQATPITLALAASMSPRATRRVVGRAAVNLFRRHLTAVNTSKPNRLGGKRTNFYRVVGRGTNFAETSDGVRISVGEGSGIPRGAFRRRVVGGTIRMKDKWLTVPVNAEAHGRRASEFGDTLEVVFDKGGRPLGLARKVGTEVKTRGKGKRVVGGTRKLFGEWMYVFRDQVRQKPDPEVVPTRFDIAAATIAALNEYREGEVARAKIKKGRA